MAGAKGASIGAISGGKLSNLRVFLDSYRSRVFPLE